MKKKYHNLTDTELFGNYIDPFGDRRENGPTRFEGRFEFKPYCYEDSMEDYFCWFGHSSVLLHLNRLNILFDPVFSKYASPVQIAGPKRFIGKTMDANQLPEIDVCLISHCHYDHLDKQTIKGIKDKTKRFIVPMGLKRMLVTFGVQSERIVELDWYESAEYETLKVHCCPTQHGSNRTGFDGNESLWCSWFIQSDRNIYFTGDGGYSNTFKEIRERFGNVDLCFVECGQYNVRWHGYHMFPEEGVQACLDLNAKLSVPVHNGAYNLSDHYYKEPVHRFERRSAELNLDVIKPVINKNEKF